MKNKKRWGKKEKDVEITEDIQERGSGINEEEDKKRAKEEIKSSREKEEKRKKGKKKIERGGIKKGEKESKIKERER